MKTLESVIAALLILGVLVYFHVQPSADRLEQKGFDCVSSVAGLDYLLENNMTDVLKEKIDECLPETINFDAAVCDQACNISKTGARIINYYSAGFSHARPLLLRLILW